MLRRKEGVGLGRGGATFRGGEGQEEGYDIVPIKEVVSPSMTIKAVGHQWFWSYEFSDFVTKENNAVEFDSYMMPESDLEDGQLRLLEVDNRVVLPVDTHVRFVVTGADVIHDFAVPSLGLKIDCCPGRTKPNLSYASSEIRCSYLMVNAPSFRHIWLGYYGISAWIPLSCTPTR